MRFKQFIAKHKWFSIIILLFAAIKIALLTKLDFLMWDEAVYLAMGKYIYSGGASGFIEIIRPIFLPSLIGFPWLLKIDYVLSSKIIMILFSIAYLAVAYLVAAKIFNRNIAAISVLFLAITPVFFGYSSFVLTEVPSTVFILLAIYFFLEKRSIFLAGMFSAFAFSFRFPAGLVLFIIAALILLRYMQEKKSNIFLLVKNYVLLAVTFLFFMVPYLLFNYFQYRAETSKLWHALFRPWILGLWHQNNPAGLVITGTFISKVYNIVFYPANLFITNIFLAFVIVALILWVKKQYKNFQFNAIMVAFLIFLLYFTYILNKQIRFSITFLPFLAMLAAYGFCEAWKYLNKPGRTRAILVILLIFQLFIIGYIVQSNNVQYILAREEPKPLIREFFLNNKISGKVMATDPLPAVYIDNSIVPNFYSPDHLVSDFSSASEISAIIYYPRGIWCAVADTRCLSDRERLTQYFIDNYNMVFYDNETYVFSKNFSLASLNSEESRGLKLMVNPNGADSIVVFRIENAGSLYREDQKGNIWKFDEFKKINRIFNATPVTWTIIPADIFGLSNSSKAYLKDCIKTNSINIAQKGYSHKDNGLGSEFSGLSTSAQMEKIESGRKILEQEFSQKIYSFVPPFNSADENTIKVLDNAGYLVYSSTSGDFLYFKDKNINRYDLSISFTDWQQQKNLDFSSLKAKFDSLSNYKDYVIVSVEYYMLAGEDFASLEKFLGYVKSGEYLIMNLAQLDEWYRYRDSANLTVVGDKITLFAPENKQKNQLTLGFYYSGNFTINVKSANIINLNNKDIKVCLNKKCVVLTPRKVVKVEI